MKTILIAFVALVVGLSLGVLHGEATYRHLRRQLKVLKAGKVPRSFLRSVTEFLFATTQIFALGWVSISYGIAVYSTIVLMQPFPVVELSQQAIDTILKVVGLKVVGNIFEHNDGPVFGRSTADSGLGSDPEEPDPQG